MTKVATTTLRSLAGFIAVAASAAGGVPTIVHWAAPVNGHWSQAVSWSPAIVPDNASGGSFHALIDAPGAAYTVTVSDVSPTLDALTIDAAGAALKISAGSILRTTSLHLTAGSIAVHDHASLVITGDVICAGRIERNTASGGLHFEGAHLTNSGVIAANSGQITIESPVFTNTGTLRGNGQSGGEIVVDRGVPFINDGRLDAAAHSSVIRILHDLTQQSTSTTAIGLKTVFPPNMSSGSIEVIGHATLDGALEVYGVNILYLAWGNAWRIMEYASRTGDFTSFSFPELANPEYVWWAEPGETRYRIGVPHIADLDHDGYIWFSDLNILIGNFNAPGTPARGDIDGDGFVGFADLNAMLSRFGQSAW